MALKMDETNLCRSCSIYLQEPFIRCVSCPGIVDVCLQVRKTPLFAARLPNFSPECFAKGSQFARHSNDHDYAVMVGLADRPVDRDLFFFFRRTPFRSERMEIGRQEKTSLSSPQSKKTDWETGMCKRDASER